MCSCAEEARNSFKRNEVPFQTRLRRGNFDPLVYFILALYENIKEFEDIIFDNKQ